MNRVFYVTSMDQLYRKVRHLASQHMWYRADLSPLLMLQGQILNRENSLCSYNFDLHKVNSIDVQWYALNGGSNICMNQAVQLENLLIHYPHVPIESFDLKVQNDEQREAAEENMWKIVLNRLTKMQANQPAPDDKQLAENREWVMDMVENCFISYYAFKKFDNIILWAEMVYKLFTKKSVTGALLAKINSLFDESEVQGLESTPDVSIKEVLRMMRSGFDTLTSMDENPVLKKFYKLYCFMLTQGFLSRLGMTLTDEEYSKLELRTMTVAFASRRGLWLAAFDVILFLAEKIYEFKETGDISVFTHTDAAYADWSVRCDKIMALSTFTGNLEAHGTTHFSYIADLNAAIEEGEAYVKYTKLRSGYESAFLRKRLGQLQLIKAQQTTIKFAQQERKAPFGLLLHGPSGVGKSTFAKLLFYYFGKLRGLDTDDHYLYRRSPTDDYWTNFDTSMWCIQLDDIAFLNPNKSNEVDPTLKELLNIVNNVPYVPSQAALDDKGKTPIRCEFVIATSNTADLNAHEYFSCPLAVQRRLPFIVTIKPKPEFQAPGGMLDPRRLNVNPSEYPNYWTITVQELKPFKDPSGRERATIVVKNIYEDVTQFLADYGETILQHDANQMAAMDCDSYMKEICVCTECKKPRYACHCPQVQSLDLVVSSSWVVASAPAWYISLWTLLFSMWSCIILYLVMWPINRWVLSLIMRNFTMRWVLYKFLGRIMDDEHVVRALGFLNSITSETHRWVATRGYLRTIVEVAAVVASTYGVYKLCSAKSEKTETKESVAVQSVEAQGNKFSTTEDQLEKEASCNVWYNSEVELTRFDLPLASQSLVGKKDDEVRDMLAHNIVCVEAVCHVAVGKSTSVMSGVFVQSHFLLVNAHLFRDDADTWDVTISRHSRTEGVSDSITMKVVRKDLIFRKDKDLCILKVLYCPPTKDILKFWAEKELTFGSMSEISRKPTGDLTMRAVHGVYRWPQMNVPSLHIDVDIYMGTLPSNIPETRNGDCGSLAIANTPKGPVIVGIHLLGRERLTGVLQVDKVDLEEMITESNAIELYPITTQGGTMPDMEANGIKRTLGPLGTRSTIRYLEQGTANVYGTFEGFRPRHSSKVCDTPLKKKICEHFNYVSDHGKPVMRGWEPWKKNLEKMVHPNCGLDSAILREITNSYFEDIVSGLPNEWEKQLVCLSNDSAVNGLPGVKFIDAINRKSSMGFPWNTSKKKFLELNPTERHPDGVTFDDEFWQRVAAIEECHAKKQRACPVFTGALKDTPTPQKKIDMKKTRVFSGSPADFAIATRKKLLSFIRLIQKNKFVFEAGPGTVCQSTEWGKIREYLVAFGEDQLVAGDFGSYDKAMVAILILAAFQIIAKLHDEAGFDQEYCDAIMAIGTDTAFSFVNFDGDLIEFYGTNPSGHALTVIINSMVNSLYMRYCYRVLNPAQEVKSFKQNVHLFTYGDDNTQGVSKTCPWYNHTAIQAVLATIGVEYTMADKTSESRPYINIKDVSFLKRYWRYDEDVGAWLAPIEEDSIKRSLCVWLPSTSINEYEKMIEVITSAVNEYFFYGREKFEKERSFLTQLLQEEPYCLYPKVDKIPQWQELYDRFWASSKELEENLNM